MSSKRAATTELNHDNWDQDDPSEHEEMGSFKTATKDVLEKRVIRTAKRRAQISGDEPNKGVFSGFGGFNKTQPSSFDFLANLTNGNKNNGSPASKSDTAVTSSLFSSKPPLSSQSSGIFRQQGFSTPASKSPFSAATSPTQSLFAAPASNSQTTASLFTASKADSTVKDSPFKTQPISSSNDAIGVDTAKTTNVKSNSTGSHVTSTIFGAPITTSNVTKSLFSNTSSSRPFKLQPVSSSTTVPSAFGTTSTIASSNSNENIDKDKKENQNDDKKMKYYSKLKGLNESVSEWIKKHVEETPLCILSPIFKDYEKYLKEMQDEYQGPEEEKTSNVNSNAGGSSTTKVSGVSEANNKSASAFTSKNLNSSSFTKSESSPSSKVLYSSFGSPNNGPQQGDNPKFAFGANTVTTSSSTTSSAGFSFGVTTSQSNTMSASSPFSTTTSLNTGTSPLSTTASTITGTRPFSTTSGLNENPLSTTSTFITGTSVNSNGAAPFSFGLGKPFSFNSNIQKPITETTDNEKDEEDEPPKVEWTPLVEENSVYDKKCKVFVKKDGIFVDNGVGTLYLKKVEESGKYQLLIRANTSLANVLVNLILASAIPTQRMGKNNVMMVCIPTPDAKPPPTPILIRVKTAEEADELLETLNKYKT